MLYAWWYVHICVVDTENAYSLCWKGEYFGYIILICVDRTIRFFLFVFDASFFFSLFILYCLFRVVHNLVSYFFNAVLTNVIGLHMKIPLRTTSSHSVAVFIYWRLRKRNTYGTVFLLFALGSFYPVDHYKRTVIEKKKKKLHITIGIKPDFS